MPTQNQIQQIIHEQSPQFVYELRYDCDDHYLMLGVFTSLEVIIERCKMSDGGDENGGGPIYENGDDGEELYVERIQVGKLMPDGQDGDRVAVIRRDWRFPNDEEVSHGKYKEDERIWGTEVDRKNCVDDPPNSHGHRAAGENP